MPPMGDTLKNRRIGKRVSVVSVDISFRVTMLRVILALVLCALVTCQSDFVTCAGYVKGSAALGYDDGN